MARCGVGRILAGLVVSGVCMAALGWPVQPAQGARKSAEVAYETLIRIPRDGTRNGMLTRVCPTAVRSPAPLVIVNHGSPRLARDRARRMPSQCREVAQFFTSRGYTVAFPLRRGYGERRRFR